MKVLNYIVKSFGIVLILLVAMLVQNCRKDEAKNGNSNSRYKISFYPEELGVCENIESTFEFRIVPAAELKWQVLSKPDWITLFPQSGTTNLYKGQVITFNVEHTGYSQGRYTGEVQFSISGTKSSFHIVLLVDNDSASIEFNKDILNFPLLKNSDTLIVNNKESFSVNWKCNNVPDYVILNDTQGYFNNDIENFIKFDIDRSVLNSWGTISDTLTFETSIGTDYNIAVSVDYNHQGGKWELPCNIVDAVYNYETDRIIAVSTEPNSLVILDPTNKKLESIPLLKTPLCISINKDASYAVVGHDAYFSYINISEGNLENMFPVSAKVFDILLGENDFVYAFPDDNTYSPDFFYCINLATGEETESTGNYADKYKACFDHSGEHIYTISVNINPEDIFKFDINQNTASYLYDSPYHGDYYFGRYIWISKNGDKIFTERTVLNASNDPVDDLLYSGAIPQDYKMGAFDDAPQAGFFVGLMKDVSASQSKYSNLVICSLDSYEKLLSFELPTFAEQGDKDNSFIYKPNGRFVFVNTEGTQVWVIQHILEKSSGEEWSVVSYNLEIK